MQLSCSKEVEQVRAQWIHHDDDTAQIPSQPKRVRRPGSAVRSVFALEPLEPRTLLSADLSGAAQPLTPEPSPVNAPLVLLGDTPSAASVAARSASGTVIGRFGTVSGDADRHFTFHTHDGTSVTFSLTGAGVGEVLEGEKGPSIRLHSTDERSMAQILTTGGSGQLSIEHVTIDGPLGALIASTADLVGGFAAQGPVGSVAVRALDGGTISAPSIRGMTILGNVNQGTLLVGAQLGNDGRIGGAGDESDVFGPGSIASLYVGGSMRGSIVRIGQDPVDGTFDNGNDALQGGRDSAMTFIRIEGALSDDTRFVGGAFPATIQLAGERIPVEGDGRFQTATAVHPVTEGDMPAPPQAAMSSALAATQATVVQSLVSDADVHDVTPVTEEGLPAPPQAAVSAPTVLSPATVTQSLVSTPDQHEVRPATEDVLPTPQQASVSPAVITSPAIVTQSVVSNPAPSSEVAAATNLGTSEWDSAVALWTSHMLEYGRRHGQELADLASGTPQDRVDATYYDAERVFYQIAAYTGDPSWANDAQIAERYYRDQYVLPNHGDVPGYWNFTQGLRMDYERTGDVISRVALLLLSEHAAFAERDTPIEWTESAESSREVAYAIMSHVNAEAVGAAPIPKKTQLIDQAMRHIDQWFVSKSASYMPFMVGLTAQALIHAYEQTPDPRIQTAVATAVEGLWREAWLPAASAFYYAGTSPTIAAPDLNMLIAPAYAWMYRQTGDLTYRDRGDAIFAGGVHNAFLGPMKHFNQNYMWSFDYMTYRRG